ncbi:ABC transporter substrate-binding protein [Embleya sp. NPDC005575]|uniref:ABC transporter substrate-binding protein n=1 Tax=Embleya sp. NPDC005575 TaxID=3156892 RepID=UPI00339F42F0
MTRTSLLSLRSTRHPRPRRRIAVLVVATALATVLAGCGNDDETKPSAAGTPKQGGSLTMSLPGDATSLDPFSTSYVNVADGSRMSALYDSLVWTDPSTGSIRPQIAESLAVNGPKADTWRLKIRPNVKFSDGTVFDAEAVRFNWDRHKDPKVGSFQRGAASVILSLNVVDPLTLDIKLVSENANFDHLVTRNLSYIASPTALRAGPAGIGDKPVGAGPYKLVKWERGVKQTYTRNPDYWQLDKGLPHLDNLTITVDTDVNHSVGAVDDGKTDLTVAVDPLAVAQAEEKKLGVTRIGLNGGQMVVFNLNVAPFKDLRARRAFVYAFNGIDINQKFFGGKGTPAKGIFAASSPVANIQLAASENDPKRAKELFDDVTAGGTKPLKFTYWVPQAPASIRVAEYMKQVLNSYPGVQMEVKVVDIATYIRTVRSGTTEWAAALGQQWIDDPEPGIYDLLHSRSMPNNSSYENATVDTALEDARRTTDPAQRRDAYTRVQLQVNKDMPFWVYQEAVTAAVYNPRITGIQLVNDGVVLWDRIGTTG